MSKEYNAEEIREKLNSLNVGDKIKINYWKNPMFIKGISENFIVAAEENNKIYTILERRLREHNHNRIEIGKYHCGPDYWLFGYGCESYQFDNPVWIKKYLDSFENGDSEISERRAVPINRIIKCRK